MDLLRECKGQPMQTERDELRDELVAILGAGRELTVDTDKQLADAFIDFLEHRQERVTQTVKAVETAEQPHYSLRLAGAAWGAAAMFLLLLLLLDNPSPLNFLLVAVLLLSVVAGITRAFLYMARSGWRIPHIRVTVASPGGTARNRG